MKTNPEDLKLLEDRLDGLDVFTPRQLEILLDYGVATLGDLLGATRGLSEADRLDAVEPGLGAAAQSLAERIPEAILTEYRDYQAPSRPMGWLPEENDDQS